MSSDELKKKQEDKLRFECTYIADVVFNGMAYLDLADDDRTRELYGLLDKTMCEIRRLKDRSFEPSKKMNDNTREEMVSFLKDTLMDHAFGDGMEDDYILDGTTFKGLHNYTDEQLCEEFLQVSGPEEDLYVKATLEMEVNKHIA